MKKYKLLRDIPDVKAGAIFEVVQDPDNKLRYVARAWSDVLPPEYGPGQRVAIEFGLLTVDRNKDFFEDMG